MGVQFPSHCLYYLIFGFHVASRNIWEESRIKNYNYKLQYCDGFMQADTIFHIKSKADRK